MMNLILKFENSDTYLTGSKNRPITMKEKPYSTLQSLKMNIHSNNKISFINQKYSKYNYIK